MKDIGRRRLGDEFGRDSYGQTRRWIALSKNLPSLEISCDEKPSRRRVGTRTLTNRPSLAAFRSRMTKFKSDVYRAIERAKSVKKWPKAREGRTVTVKSSKGRAVFIDDRGYVGVGKLLYQVVGSRADTVFVLQRLYKKSIPGAKADVVAVPPAAILSKIDP